MTTPRQRYRLPREQRVADIMTAARAVFEAKGYDEALLTEIAERADVVEGTIYRYFENKHDLLLQVVAHWYEEMLSDYDENLRGITGTWNRLRYMIWRHLECIRRNPRLCRLMLEKIRTSADYAGTTVFDLNRRYTRRTIDIMRSAVRMGEFRTDAPMRLARDMIYGCVEHHAWGYMRGEGELDVDATADRIADIVYRGLAAEEATLARLERVVERLEAFHSHGRPGATPSPLAGEGGPRSGSDEG